MTFVLDTDVVAELMRAEPAEGVRRWIDAVDPASVVTASITVAEIGYGIARLTPGRRRDALAAAFGGVFGIFADRVLPCDAAAAAEYGQIVVTRERAGTPISGFDAQIAAICRTRDAVLATRNTNDFLGLGLGLIDPWNPAV